MSPEELRATAEKMAHSIGISVYINGGCIHQNGPGDRGDPPKPTDQESHGRFTIAAAAKPQI